VGKRLAVYRSDAPPVELARVLARSAPTCKHLSPELGGCFDYCPDCGAVRSSRRPGEDAGPWHSCDGCAL